MKFTVGEVSYFEEVGYSTDKWRKSIDGKLAMCHIEKAEILCDENNIAIYDRNSAEFEKLLVSAEWTEQIEEVV